MHCYDPEVTIAYYSSQHCVKVLEKLIYDRIALCLTTCSNQFGFKAKHSTDMPIYTLKEAVLKYHSLNSNVYSCFLDASKAFDRGNHYVLLLFDKLVM